MRMKLTDKRIEKLRSKTTIEVWDTDLRGFGIRHCVDVNFFKGRFRASLTPGRRAR